MMYQFVDIAVLRLLEDLFERLKSKRDEAIHPPEIKAEKEDGNQNDHCGAPNFAAGRPARLEHFELDVMVELADPRAEPQLWQSRPDSRPGHGPRAFVTGGRQFPLGSILAVSHPGYSTHLSTSH